jgi:hypothetical protein
MPGGAVVIDHCHLMAGSADVIAHSMHSDYPASGAALTTEGDVDTPQA